MNTTRKVTGRAVASGWGCGSGMIRPRFTITPEKWRKACDYAKATNRTPSELVVEALEQIQARYPKRHHCAESELDDMVAKVSARLGLQVQAGTSGEERR